MTSYKSQNEKDNFFMKIAIEQATEALKKNEVPVGCVIVNHDYLLAKSHNLVEQENSQTCHAEILALKDAGRKQKDWRLNGATIYITLEPCRMCIGAILLSRVSRIVFAASAIELDKEQAFEIYKLPMPVESGVLEKEAKQLLKTF